MRNLKSCWANSAGGEVSNIVAYSLRIAHVLEAERTVALVHTSPPSVCPS